ncbi:MAG TPA: TIGR03757 family integrating conjugative element protein [Gammaproteobacteria bacterium]|nr:TIGR03757 family integrating conjugative element protein [Gammaproteobacteria bacterium]
MIRKTHSNRFVSWGALVLVVLVGNVAQAVQRAVVRPHIIEVFTSADLSVTGEAAINRQPTHREIEIHVYELDGIKHIEAKLSKGLTANPDQSKRIVLQRIQQLNEAGLARMKRTAMGLAKVVQYGINRYPAIVFDGEVVIYGVTDLREALRQYQQWRAGGKR